MGENLSALLGQLLLIAINNEVHLHQPLNNTNTQQNTTYLFTVQDWRNLQQTQKINLQPWENPSSKNVSSTTSKIVLLFYCTDSRIYESIHLCLDLCATTVRCTDCTKILNAHFLDFRATFSLLVFLLKSVQYGFIKLPLMLSFLLGIRALLPSRNLCSLLLKMLLLLAISPCCSHSLWKEWMSLFLFSLI